MGRARRARLDGRLGRRGRRRRRPRLRRGGRALRGARARALPRAVLLDRRLALPALPADLRAEVAAGDTSWTLAFGPLVPDLDTADRVAIVGGDGIYELEGAEREVLDDDRRDPAARRRPRRRAGPKARGRRRPRRDPQRAPSRRSRSRPAASRDARSSTRSSTPRRASSSGSRSASTRRCRTRSRTRTRGSSSPARCRSGRPGASPSGDDAGAGRRRGGEVVRGRGRGRRLRDGDPGARRHRLHLGARAAPPVQARALDRELRASGTTPPGRGRGVAPRTSRVPARPARPGLTDPRRLRWKA